MAQIRQTDKDTGLYGMRLPHEWGYEEARPRKGDVVEAKRRSYVYLFFDASRAAEADRELAALLRACSRELAAGNRVEAHGRYYDECFDVVRGRLVGKQRAIFDRLGYSPPATS